MITRIWHGWATHKNADSYETIVRTEVIPGILAKKINGFRRIELMRRERQEDVEFVTVMWFDNLDAVKAFVGPDYETAYVPNNARQALARFDAQAQRYDILDVQDNG
ncbi:hypothetical protein GCM10007276_09840 [Agaricicola taiwanensis]|uniref:Antibiotic biosynthesis monooxygenase n=1 Tax=Agaricicola taiwanensis TaxID=591372 RepID=A0A8J2YFT0_9RHOB|nr:antibiotic biosynthesis monooxygenase [Agaricicola taiwanensis]GGE34467.1 hypothetical protein GCM10007276_09840 [Agaricicola taiwanensis]